MSSNGQTTNGAAPDPKDVPRRLRPQHNVRLAAIVLAISAVGLYLGFTKDVPFTGGFQVKAVFTSANSIRSDSPVRIAGVNVGKVLDVERYKNTSSALVTMEIDDNGLPMHKDAQMKIRPRIFLEGNFFVDVRPGTPSSPELKDGEIVPVTQTSTPVQLDQVLTSLQYSSREDLQNLLQGLGTALDTKPTAAENAQLPAEVRDTTGGEALNKSLKYTPDAFKGTAIVNQGFLGEHPGDLGKLIKGLRSTTEQLGANEADLASFITNFSHTMQGLGSNPAALQRAIGLLGPTVDNTYNALGSVNAALPSLSAFSLALIPAAKETPATVAVGTPWAKEAAVVLDKNHLQATMKLLEPITVSTAQTVAQQIQILPETRNLAQCFFYKLLPTGDQKISDSGTGYDFSTNQEAYKEFWFSLVGLAGESQNFDGNGQFIRAQTGGAQQTQNSSTGGNLQVDMTEYSGQESLKTPLWGNMPNAPLGTSPRYFGRSQQPDYKPTNRCVDPTNPVTSTVNLNDPTAAKGAPDKTGSPG
jgi:ABC-type transporter Mla subunit MlaD